MSISKEQLCSLLLNVLSPDNQVLKQTENDLKILDRLPGFTAHLLDIIQDKINHNNTLRYVASIHLKNLVSNNWRNKKGNIIIINDQEKQLYRERLLNIIGSYDHNGEETKITKHLSIVISVVARADYPTLWPNLFPVLFEYFDKGNEHHKMTSLITIKYVVNELASRRFPQERKAFNQISIELFQVFYSYWDNSMNQLNQVFNNISSQIDSGTSTFESRNTTLQQYQLQMELLIQVSKILRRVVELGHTEYQENQSITSFFNSIFQKNSILLSSRNKIGNDNIIIEQLERLILINQKIIIRAQAMNPLSFIAFITSSLDYFNRQIIGYNPHLANDQQVIQPFKRSLVQSLMYLRSVVDCVSYQTEILDPDEDESVALELSADNKNATSATHVAQQMINDFFNYNMLVEHLRALVSNYLIITPEEMESWEEEPEMYILQLDAESHQYELKPCAYNLFILIMRHFHTNGVKIELDMMKYVMELASPLSNQQLLLKEACYMTIGLGYYDLYDQVNFEQLFQSVFVHELRMSEGDERLKILTRRVTWLIGYWIPKIAESLIVPIGVMLLELVGHKDMVIALTAADSLKAFIDDYEFNLETFAPYVNQTLLSLLNLFNRATEIDTKTNLLTILGVIFVKLNESIKPFAANIITLFAALWSNGEAPPHLKSSIVRCVTLFLQAMNSDPSDYATFLLPVIEHSTMPRSEESVYLLEDGLELWHAYICRVSSFSSPLLQLFRNLVGVIKQTVEYHELCLRILDAYILIGQQHLLTQYGNDIVQCILVLLGDVRDTSTSFVVQPLDRILQIFPVDGCVLIEPALSKLYHLTLDNDEPELAKVQYLGVFARVCVANPMFIFQFLDGIASRLNQTNSTVIAQFFDIWFEHIDSISSSEQRKLTAIALCNLIATSRKEVVGMIGQIITIVVGIRTDIDPSTGSDGNAFFSQDGFELPDSSATDIQLKLVTKQDPLSTVDMSTYVFNKMKESSLVHGNDLFQSAIQSMHPTVLELAIPKNSS